MKFICLLKNVSNGTETKIEIRVFYQFWTDYYLVAYGINIIKL